MAWGKIINVEKANSIRLNLTIKQSLDKLELRQEKSDAEIKRLLGLFMHMGKSLIALENSAYLHPEEDEILMKTLKDAAASLILATAALSTLNGGVAELVALAEKGPEDAEPIVVQVDALTSGLTTASAAISAALVALAPPPPVVEAPPVTEAPVEESAPEEATESAATEAAEPIG